MNIWIRILLTVITAILAVYYLIDKRKTDFEPYFEVRLKLWILGFLCTLCMFSLDINTPFLEGFLLKFFVSILNGFVWAFKGTSLVGAGTKRR